MRLGDLPVGSRHVHVRWTLLAVASIALAFLGAWLLQSAIPRHIVLASGLGDGMYHEYAQRYTDLGRIEQAAARIRAPLSYASEAYTLREHIGLVRRVVMAKA